MPVFVSPALAGARSPRVRLDCSCQWTAEERRRSFEAWSAEIDAYWASAEGHAVTDERAGEEAALTAWLDENLEVTVSSLGGLAPEQWWGDVDGRSFYFRERHDQWQLADAARTVHVQTAKLALADESLADQADRQYIGRTRSRKGPIMSTVESRRRSRRLELRTTPSERDLIERAVAVTETDLTEFVVTNAVDAARRVLADRDHFELSPEALAQWEQINARRARDLPGLRRLMERPSPFAE